MPQHQKSNLGGVITATSVPMFMTALDNLVMTFALPVMRAQFNATLSELQWFVNSYTLVFATLMMPMSALGDRLGRKLVFICGIVVFTLASAGSALSTTSASLIAARALQGLGAAAIVPLSLTILSVASPSHRRPLAIGIWGGVNGLGIAVGPIVGGAVVSGLDWSAIFWLNVPIGAIALVLSVFCLPESAGRQSRFDSWGVLLATAFFLSLTWAIVNGSQVGWTDTRILGGLLLAAMGLAGFLAREKSSTDAFLPLRLFRQRTFSLANLAGFLFTGGIFGAIFFLSQFLQVSMGYSALQAGIRAMPWTLAPMVIAPISGVLVHRLGVRAVLAAGMAFQTLALGLIAFIITADVAYQVLIAPMLLAGVGMGLSFAPLSTAVLLDQPEPEHGIASGVNSTLRQLGMALGIAGCTAVFSAVGHYIPGQPFIDGLRPVLIACSVTLAAATVCVSALPTGVNNS